MIIKSCPKCGGNPYTTDLSVDVCPSCGAKMEIEAVPDGEINNRRVLSVGDKSAGYSNVIFGEKSSIPPSPKKSEGDYRTAPNDDIISAYSSYDTNLQEEQLQESAPAQRDNPHEIFGSVVGYTNSNDEGGNYRRIFVTQIIDALFYGQRTENIVHRFIIRPDNYLDGSHDIPVVMHGILSAGSAITDNTKARVTGRYKNGVFYARRMRVVSNGHESPVRTQISFARLFMTIFAFLFTFSGLGLFLFNRDGVNAFFNLVKVSLIVFAIVFAILFIITLIVAGRRPLIFMSRNGLSVLSLIDAIIAGIGTYFLVHNFGASFESITNGAIGMLGPVLIVVIGIVLLVSIFRR